MFLMSMNFFGMGVLDLSMNIFEMDVLDMNVLDFSMNILGDWWDVEEDGWKDENAPHVRDTWWV